MMAIMVTTIALIMIMIALLARVVGTNVIEESWLLRE